MQKRIVKATIVCLASYGLMSFNPADTRSQKGSVDEKELGRDDVHACHTLFHPISCRPKLSRPHQVRKLLRASHLAKKCSDICPRTVFLFFSLPENCSLLGTDNVLGQIAEHIFTPNGGYCLYTCENAVAKKYGRWMLQVMGS